MTRWRKRAIKIYEGQLLALNTVIKDDNLKKVEEMKVHEKEHCDYFEKEIKKEILNLLNYHYGFIRSGFRFWFYNFRKKAAMLCTASVEEVDEHYANQISQLQPDEKLKDKLSNLEDELS